jgi:hypothetical protein
MAWAVVVHGPTATDGGESARTSRCTEPFVIVAVAVVLSARDTAQHRLACRAHAVAWLLVLVTVVELVVAAVRAAGGRLEATARTTANAGRKRAICVAAGRLATVVIIVVSAATGAETARC